MLENAISGVFPLSQGLFGTFIQLKQIFFPSNWKKSEKSNNKNILRHHLMADDTPKSTHNNKLFHEPSVTTKKLVRFFSMQLCHALKTLPLSSS